MAKRGEGVEIKILVVGVIIGKLFNNLVNEITWGKYISQSIQN